MAQFTVQIENLHALTQSLKRYPKIAENILQKAVDASQAVFAKHTLKDDPVPWRTGNLLHSFRFQSGKLQARWFPTARYAPLVEYGRGAIFPKTKKSLSWKSGGGVQIFAQMSRPTKANPFMKKILQKSNPDVQKVFRHAGDLILDEITKIII